MAHPGVARLCRVAHDALEAGLALLFPPSCVGCGRIGEHSCATCAQAVEATPQPQCARCGLHQPTPTLHCPNCVHYAASALQLTRVAALHTAPLREAIHAFKYDDQPVLAPLLARDLVATYVAPPWSTLLLSVTAIVPVPLHEQRLAERGYNQAELLATHFGNAVGLPVQPTWLERVRVTRQQVGLDPSERRANVDGAFVATAEVAGHCLLLIDDVYTTGATLRACAAAATEAGALVVYGLTLAQPVRRGHASAPVAPPDMPWREGEL